MESQLATALAREAGVSLHEVDAAGRRARTPRATRSSCAASPGRWTGRCGDHRPAGARRHRRARRAARPRRRELRGRAGRVRLPVRPERGRQDHLPEGRARPPAARRGRDRGARRPPGDVGERGRLPAAGEGLQPDLPGARRGRDRREPARGVAGARVRGRPRGGPSRPRPGGRRAAARRGRCAGSPAASCSGPTWPAPSSTSPRSCCSTSPPPGSTPAGAPSSWTSWPGSRPARTWPRCS